MDGDLAGMIRPGRTLLAESQCQSILFQVMCGLLCLHTACVVHRDLKPSNVLVNAGGLVKLADLGLSRSIEASSQQDCMALTEYVVTRFYRAPEVVLTATEYTYAVDVWSVGCILGEMLFREPLFKGKHSLDQIRTIVAAFGGLANEDLRWIPQHTPAAKFLNNCVTQASTDQNNLLQRLEDKKANPLVTELIHEMLAFNPANRISVEEVFKHEYLLTLAETKSADIAAARNVKPVDWSFDWDLCYDDYGEPRQFNDFDCRRAMNEARELVASTNLPLPKQGCNSLDFDARTQSTTHDTSVTEEDTNLNTIESGPSCSKSTCGEKGYRISGIPIAAVRRPETNLKMML
jgi:serine/threonine protein kinase